MYKDKLQYSWASMMYRCYRANNSDYQHYGGRGVRVCERWHDFSNFKIDMVERPQGMTLDRIDPEKDYSPENCRWASRKDQNRNKRNNKLVTYQGARMSAAAAAELCGISAATLYMRLRAGWTEDQLFVPIYSIRQNQRTRTRNGSGK